MWRTLCPCQCLYGTHSVNGHPLRRLKRVFSVHVSAHRTRVGTLRKSAAMAGTPVNGFTSQMYALDCYYQCPHVGLLAYRCMVIIVTTSAQIQGSKHTSRVGGAARFLSIIGLGKKGEASAAPEWGPAVYQVPCQPHPTLQCLPLCMEIALGTGPKEALTVHA